MIEGTTPFEEMPDAAGRDGRQLRLLFTLGGAAGAVILPFFTLLLKDRGLTPDRIGLVASASALTGVAAGPVWSHIADTQLGTARTLLISSVASAVTALVLFVAGFNLWVILVVVAALKIAQAPTNALSDALALGHLGSDRMDEYGTIRLWLSLGWAVAVIACGALFQGVGLDPLLPLFAAGTLAFATVAARFPPARPKREDRSQSRLGSMGEAFRASPRLLPFLAGLLLVSVATSASWTFIPLRISPRGRGLFLVGLSAGVAALIEIPFFRGSARLAARFGLRTLYLVGTGIYAAVMVVWALTANPVTAAIGRAVVGAGFGLVYAALVIAVGRLIPERLRNTGQALLQMTTMGIGPILGSGLGGLVYQHLSPSILFGLAAATTAAGASFVGASLAGEAFKPSPAAEQA